MHEEGSLLQAAVVFLFAAVLTVPLAKRLQLGAVLGYLLAGVIIGPSVLGLIGNPQSVMHISELGVVLLLFIIGLELSPRRLWVMRKAVFGVGLAQVLLTGLVIGGMRGEPEIAALLEKDNTANGQKAAAGARAAIPSADAKAAAWKTLVETDDYTNALVNAASLGFGRVNDVNLLEPYSSKYFESALKIWETKTYHIAEYLLVNLYPLGLANRKLVAASENWLNLPEVQDKPALKRIIIENLANVQRALKAQDRDLAS